MRLTQPPLQRLGFGGFRTLFVHEWNVVGRDDSRNVADHYACNAFNRLLSLIVYPRNDRRARRRANSSFLHTRVDRNPIYFPGLAAVG